MNPPEATGNSTWGEWLNKARQTLADAGRSEPDATAEFALADILECNRAELALHLTEQVDDARRARADAWLTRLAGGEPLAYVTGWAPFLCHHIRCDRRALIPRPETEELAQLIIDCDDLWSRPSPAVADIGTGTGCLAIALAVAYPDAQVTGVDVSPDALALARENARALGAASVRWAEGDGLRGIEAASLDAIVSNAPYVTTGEWAGLDTSVRDWEPRGALDGGADGLDVIRGLVRNAPRVLRPGGWIFLEIGETQGPAVLMLMKDGGLQECEIQRDFSGHDRFAIAHR